MGLLFLTLSGILKAILGFQIILLILSTLFEHTLLAEKNSAVKLLLIECDVWTAWARYLFSSFQKKLGGAIDIPLLLTGAVLYVIARYI